MEIRFPKDFLNDYRLACVRPYHPKAFLKPGQRMTGKSDMTKICLFAAGPEIKVTEECYSGHWLN